MADTTNLIRIVQLPVIEAKLLALKDGIKQRAEEAASLACTNETIQAVKKTRAELNTEFKELEDTRKAIKRQLMAPLEAFEKTYKECVTTPYAAADAALKGKISSVEDGIKAKCAEEMQAYFTELCAAEKVEWLKYEWLGLKISMTDANQKSHNRLREQIAVYVTGVSSDVAAISKMENADEIMAEYRERRNLAASIGAVESRHKRIEAERAARAAIEEQQKAERAAVEKVEAALQPPVSAPIPAPAPVSVRATIPPTVVAGESPERVVKCAFTVHATKPQLKKLVEFMKEIGVKYE